MANHVQGQLPVSGQNIRQLSGGECGSTIAEMKRLARCETDAELATTLGKTKAAVAQWRRRGLVPEGAILRLFILLDGEKAA